MLKNLNELIEIAKQKKTCRLAVAAAEDKPVLEAVKNAFNEGIIYPIFVGDEEKIKLIAKEINFDIADFEIINECNPAKASVKAVALIREDKADVLMKGMVSTGVLLKAVVDKEKGLRTGNLISHIAFFDSPYYHKVFSLTDAAMNMEPDINDKVAIIKNAVEAYSRLNLKNPKVAAFGPVETVNPKMQPTIDASMLSMMNRRKQIKGCIVDGPLALDNAISLESAEHKGIDSPVAGDVDILLAPDIYTANAVYKTLNFLGGCFSAAVIMGAKVPIVLTSRADSDRSKMLSIALAAAME